MITTFLIGLISVLFAYISGITNQTKYLLISFVILLVFLSLRYDFGNDYMAYFEIYDDINDTSWSEVKDVSGIGALGETMEFGFIYLLKFFTVFSDFFFFIFANSLLLCAAYFLLIKKYVSLNYAWMGVFLFVFDPNLMLVELSALRQTLAIICFLFSIQYLIKRNVVKYIICILIASSFHYSAIILLPLYFAFSPKPVLRLEPFIYIGLYLFLLLFGEVLLHPIEAFTNTYLPKYLGYVTDAEKANIESGYGLILYSFVYLVLLLFAKRDTEADRVMYRIVAIFMILTPLSLILNMLTRMTFYLEPALVVVIPQMLSITTNRLFKISFIALLIFITLVTTRSHFNSDTYKENYYNYKTIFSESNVR